MHLVEKKEYLENKSRQNNIRIHQVREGAEGGDIVKFLKTLISEKLEIPAAQLDIVAAHRSYQRKPAYSGAPPRSIIARFLTWDTRQRVFCAAWTKKVSTSRAGFSLTRITPPKYKKRGVCMPQ